jgi:PAS domain-containing protein
MEWHNSLRQLPDNGEKVLVSARGIYIVCLFDHETEEFRADEKHFKPASSTYWTNYTPEFEDYDENAVVKQKREQFTSTFFQQVIDTSADAVIVLDPQLNFLIANKKYCEIMGIKNKDLKQKNLFDINPRARESVQHEYILRALTGESLRLDPMPAISKPQLEVETQFTPLIISGHIEGVVIRSVVRDKIAGKQ